MTNQELAELIFPNITKTIDDYERIYPNRNLKEGAKVVRFAPSPTGFMHIGNMMSATINYCLAKSSAGIFYLRNEDTDQSRSVEGAVEFIYHTLKHYGIMPDEYEFNGDADMTAQGLKAPTQSLQGSSVMAEVGFNYQPTPDSPWSFDLNMRGYTGERQGGSFNVQATYTF